MRYLFNNLRNRAMLGSGERNRWTRGRARALLSPLPQRTLAEKFPGQRRKKANYKSAGRQQKAGRARAAPAQSEHRLRLANIESTTARRVCASFCAAGCRSTKERWIKSTKLWPLTLPRTVIEDRPQIDDPPTSLSRPNEETDTLRRAPTR